LLTGDKVEFAKDPSGAIMGLTLQARRGEQKAIRKQ
jgi:hypothetical protein